MMSRVEGWKVGEVGEFEEIAAGRENAYDVVPSVVGGDTFFIQVVDGAEWWNMKAESSLYR